MNKNKFKLLIGVGVLALILLGVFVYQNNKSQKQNNLKGAQSATGVNQVFQPEAQMLSQAIDANKAATGGGVVSTAPDHPLSAGKNLPPYAYDPTTCQNNSAPYLCFAAFYKILTSNYGASIAIADMKQRFNQNSVIVSDCHPLMHVVGRTASESYASVAEAFSHGDVFCWSGYYHGIMEGMVAKIGLKNLPAELNKICADVPGKASYNFDYYNCVHGLGHGVMAQLGDDVFASLKMCDNVTGSWEQSSCYSGVYMQNIIDATNVADTDNVVKDLKPNDPLYPCTAVEDKYKYQCYLGQTSYALQVSNYNFSKVAQLCTTVAEPYRDTCFQSYGRDAANQAYHDAAKTTSTCNLAADKNDRTNCMIGAVKEIISYYHAETQATAYCSIQPQPDKTTCQQTADSYYKNF